MENSGVEMELSSLPREKWWSDNYLYNIDGFWFMPHTVPRINKVLNHFKPLSTDIILASFPKTGTTLLKSLLHCIVNRSSMHLLATQHPHELVPSLTSQEFSTLCGDHISMIDHSPRNRIFSTHIPYQLLAKTLDSSDCRVVYVTRNPKDAMVSAWHYVNTWGEAKKEPLPLEEGLEKILRGISHYGPLHDHVMGYKTFSIENPEKVFFVTYEDLLENPKPHVKNLAGYLGYPFDTEEQVEEVVKCCSFEVLSNHEVNKSEKSPTWSLSPYNSYFRKGVVGDHKNFLSADAIERIDALTREKYHSAGFMYGI